MAAPKIASKTMTTHERAVIMLTPPWKSEKTAMTARLRQTKFDWAMFTAMLVFSKNWTSLTM